jgi:hypothetical protein
MKRFWLFYPIIAIGLMFGALIFLAIVGMVLWLMLNGVLLMFFSFVDSPSIMQIVFRFSLGLILFSGAGICGFVTIKTVFFNK